MNSLLAAVAAIPRIASALEALANGISEINSRAAKARASQRKQTKDEAVDARLAELVDVRMSGDETGQRTATDGEG